MVGRVVPAGDSDPAGGVSEALPPPEKAAPAWSSLGVDSEVKEATSEDPDQIQTDVAIVDLLASADFGGPDWERYAIELVRYGIAIMSAWLTTGEIFIQCKLKNCYPGHPPKAWTDEEIARLAHETVAAAIVAFHKKALIGGGWDPTRGAGLKSYFIGACIYAFPNQFRHWMSEVEAQGKTTQLDLNDQSSTSRSSVDSAEDTAISRMRALEALDSISDHRTKCVLFLHSQGYSYSEIGEILSISRKAIDGILARHRQRIEKRNGRQL
jgi:RNA polymerase sigma factor (sigma-70 family)